MAKQSKKSGIAATFLAMLVLAAVGAAVYGAYLATGPQFTVGLIGAVVTFSVASYQYRRTKEREAEARLFLEKSKIYNEMIQSIISLFKSAKGMVPKTDDADLAKKWIDLRSQLIVWGGHETITAVDAIGLPTSDPKEMIRRLGSLYGAIRKDLGHADPAGFGHEIALGQLVHTDRKMFE